jgi:phosphate starvation-inducible PhoH-like protein
MSGLKDIANKLSHLESMAVVQLKQIDIVRHPLVAEMLEVI